MAKLNFQQPLLQSSVSHGHSEMMLKKHNIYMEMKNK